MHEDIFSDASAEPDEPSPALGAAMEAARAAPDREEAWDQVEDLAGEEHRPDDVAQLYREVLARDLPKGVAIALCERAVRFLGEWFEDHAPVIETLKRALAIDPSASWAFRRLSLLLTVERRWDELLDQYDRVLAATPAPAARVPLLSEAAQIAKDLAGLPERAIPYLDELARIDPSDLKVFASLERLLRREARYRDLVGLWTSRLPALGRDEARLTRVQIADCLLESLQSPAEALPIAIELLAEETTASEAARLLEQIFAFPSAAGQEAEAATVKARALDELRGYYAKEQRPEEIIRVLQAALGAGGMPNRRALHSDVAGLLASAGHDAEALEHYAAVVLIAPDTQGRERLRAMAERTGRLDRYADALAGAARSIEETTAWVALVSEAARVRGDEVGDEAGAIELYLQIFAREGASAEALVDACRRLDGLLDRAGRTSDRLLVLERLAGLEEDTDTRRALLGEVARLAETQGDVDRALAAYRLVLEASPWDAVALDASIRLLSEARRWRELVAALGQAAAAPGEASVARAHRVRAARIHADELGEIDEAITAWRAIEAAFGVDDESVDALSALLSTPGRARELASVLSRGIKQAASIERQVTLRTRLADVERELLDDPEAALDSYRSALEAQPGHEPARQGLRAMLDDARVQAEAVALLVADFDVTGDWTGRLGIVEQRLAVAADDASRSAILVDAAAIEEEKREDQAVALGLLARALPLSPWSEAIERDVLRLAEATGAMRTATDALAKAVAALPDEPRAAALEIVRGRIFDAQLGEPDAALEAYLSALVVVPGSAEAASAAVRVAARAGKWGVAAKTLVASAHARGEVAADLLDAVESAAGDAGAWDGAAESLSAAVASMPALDPAIAGALERKVAAWHRDLRSDPERAEAALIRALGREGSRLDTLEMLAGVQRRAPGRSLVSTLLELAAAGGAALPTLHEAAAVALDAVGDEALAGPILARLLDAAAARLVAAEVDERDDLRAHAAFALDHLVQLATGRGEHARAVDLLVEAARWPFDAASSRAYLHRAATIAENDLDDADRAVELLRSVLEGAPGDREALDKLAAIFTREDRLGDLLALRRHELSLSDDPERRVELRLAVADLLGRLGSPDERLEVLRDNLADAPAHAESLAIVEATLSAAGRFDELTRVLEAEAAKLADAGEGEHAAELWSRASVLCESRLDDLGRAIGALERAVEAAPLPAMFDALARIHGVRGEHTQAVAWLERRLEATGFGDDEARISTIARLAGALVGTGRFTEARDCLEQALREHPGAAALRTALRKLYRSSSSWEQLVALLTTDGAGDAEELREAATVCLRRLSAPERAVPVLEALISLVPTDKVARLSLAATLRHTGDLERARRILTELIDEYGRRRPPERAEAHYQLGQVAALAGDDEEARSQLETAVAMSPEHASALRMLGELYLDAGDLERAERMYGTLLLIVLRSDAARPVDDPDDEAPSFTEVMLGLYWTLSRRGEERRAEEMLTSAFEAAGRTEREARRFEAALRRAGEDGLLLRALETRLAGGELEAPERAVVLSEMAYVLGRLDRQGEAFDALLYAVDMDPESVALRDQARLSAHLAGAMQRFVDALTGIAERSAQGGSPALAATLFLAIGEALEADLDEPARAQDAYARAEELGAEGPLIWRAMERLSHRTGDAAGRIRALRMLVTAADPNDADAQIEDIYRLAELELASEDERAAGLGSLEWALERDPRYPRAASMLRRSADLAPEPGVLALYESVARSSGDRAMLLDALDRSSRAGTATMEAVREAVDLATEAGDGARTVALLRRAVELGAADSTGLTPSTWALLALADRFETTGEPAAAADYLLKAAEMADPDEAVRLTARIAAIASGPLDSLPLAASAYERLIERGLLDREVWDALLAITRKTGDAALLERRLASAIETAFDATWRAKLRMERAKLLLDGRPDEAAAELRELVYDDDPEAVAMLTTLYEKQGDGLALAELYDRRFGTAKTRGDAKETEAVALRLGALLEKDRPDDAIDVYRSAFDAAPASTELLRRLIALYRGDERAEERADAMERLLERTSGDDAAELAMGLAALREQLEDEEAMARALEAGLAACPTHRALQARLAAFYTARERWEPLAEMRLVEGNAAEGEAAVAALREAAELYRTRLHLPREAAFALERASEIAPDDAGLVLEQARCLMAAAEPDAALARLGDALGRLIGGQTDRVALLRLRAELHLAADRLELAGEDLDAAFKLDPEGVAAEVVACLERQWATPKGRADRALLLRLTAILAERGQTSDARERLGAWLTSNPTDALVLRQALDLDLAAQRWDDAVKLAQRLVTAEEGPARVTAALLLATACEKAGRMADARAGLEAALAASPADARVRGMLERLYVDLGEHRALASMKLAIAAAATTDAERFAGLRDAGRILLEQEKDVAAAIPPLERAVAIDGRDQETMILLADAFTRSARLEDAAALLDAGIQAHKGRRSRELAVLQQRMARIAVAVGDPENAMAWLNAALDSDVQNGAVATELADVATELGQLEVAVKALRAITLMKSPEPMTRGMAYLRQAFIARHQGDMRRAVAMAKKAQMEEPALSEAGDLLTELGST